MILQLKSGQAIKLEWNYLVLEYLEEREGSMELLQEKVNQTNDLEKVRLSNSFIYAVIQANVDDVMTYKQAIRSVKPEDYPRVFAFIQKQLELQNSYKKKRNIKEEWKPQKERSEKIDWASLKFTKNSNRRKRV
ncbi:hypothetical protein MGH68_07300 [Erysipelothrix sp. D19-032]